LTLSRETFNLCRDLLTLCREFLGVCRELGVTPEEFGAKAPELGAPTGSLEWDRRTLEPRLGAQNASGGAWREPAGSLKSSPTSGLPIWAAGWA